MPVDFEALRQSLMQKEIDKMSNQEDDGKAAAISAIPMIAGVLTGNVGLGAKLGTAYASDYEKQKQANSNKLLAYLAKMQPKTPTDEIVVKQIETAPGVSKEVAFSKNNLLSKLRSSPSVELGNVPEKKFSDTAVNTGEGILMKSEIQARRKQGEKVEGTPRFYTDPTTGLTYSQNVGGQAKPVAQQKFNPVQVRAMEAAAKETTSDPFYKSNLEGVDSADKALSMLQMGSSVADAMAKFNIAKIGQSVGVLTDQDVAILAGGDKSLEGRMKQAWNNAMEGKLTEENRQGFTEVLHKLRERAVANVNERVSANYGQLKSLYNIPESETKKYMSPHARKNLEVTKPQTIEDKRARLEALKAKYGKQ